MAKGVGRKISRGALTKKKTEKKQKRPKTALLSLYLLHLYHVWKSGGGTAAPYPPLPTPLVMA